MKKFLTMALALMMVLSLFAVPTMAEVVYGDDILNGIGDFESYAPGTTFPANGTEQFKVHADTQMTATVVADGDDQYVTVTPAADTRKPQLYFGRSELVGETLLATPVEAGKTYVLSVDAYVAEDAGLTLVSTYNQTLYWWINWFDAEGAAAANTKVYAPFNTIAFHMGEWATYEAYFTVPEGVSYINGYLCMGKAGVEVSFDNLTIKETNRVNPTTVISGTGFPGAFEDAYPNENWSGGYSIPNLTMGSKQQAGTDTSSKFYAYNSDSDIGILPKEGDWFIGIGTSTTYDADHTTGNLSGQVWFSGNQTDPILEYGETYEISVWFNAANAKDSYTGEEGDKPLVPVIATNCYGTSQLSRGTEKMTFPEAYKTKGWQKLTWEYTVPEKSWYDALTASGKKDGVMDIGLACYSSDCTIGYFDDLTITKKTAAVEPTTAAVTGTTNNEAYGTVTPATATANIGDDVTFTVTPKLGYYVAAATLNGTDVLASFDAYKGGTYTVNDIAADAALAVEFAAVTAKGEKAATLPAVFAPAADSAVTFGKVLDTTDATSWGVELTKGGVGVTPANGGSYLYKANATNANGQYAIEFIGLEAGTYQIRSYVYVNGVAEFGAPSTFVVD